ncbi:hypothetical protein CLOP_g9010, partial [Closterium sp. NIES-67]
LLQSGEELGFEEAGEAEEEEDEEEEVEEEEAVVCHELRLSREMEEHARGALEGGESVLLVDDASGRAYQLLPAVVVEGLEEGGGGGEEDGSEGEEEEEDESGSERESEGEVQEEEGREGSGSEERDGGREGGREGGYREADEEGRWGGAGYVCEEGGHVDDDDSGVKEREGTEEERDEAEGTSLDAPHLTPCPGSSSPSQRTSNRVTGSGIGETVCNAGMVVTGSSRGMDACDGHRRSLSSLSGDLSFNESMEDAATIGDTSVGTERGSCSVYSRGGAEGYGFPERTRGLISAAAATAAERAAAAATATATAAAAAAASAAAAELPAIVPQRRVLTGAGRSSRNSSGNASASGSGGGSSRNNNQLPLAIAGAAGSSLDSSSNILADKHLSHPSSSSVSSPSASPPYSIFSTSSAVRRTVAVKQWIDSQPMASQLDPVAESNLESNFESNLEQNFESSLEPNIESREIVPEESEEDEILILPSAAAAAAAAAAASAAPAPTPSMVNPSGSRTEYPSAPSSHSTARQAPRYSHNHQNPPAMPPNQCFLTPVRIAARRGLFRNECVAPAVLGGGNQRTGGNGLRGENQTSGASQTRGGNQGGRGGSARVRGRGEGEEVGMRNQRARPRPGGVRPGVERTGAGAGGGDRREGRAAGPAEREAALAMQAVRGRGRGGRGRRGGGGGGGGRGRGGGGGVRRELLGEGGEMGAENALAEENVSRAGGVQQQSQAQLRQLDQQQEIRGGIEGEIEEAEEEGQEGEQGEGGYTEGDLLNESGARLSSYQQHPAGNGERSERRASRLHRSNQGEGGASLSTHGGETGLRQRRWWLLTGSSAYLCVACPVVLRPVCGSSSASRSHCFREHETGAGGNVAGSLGGGVPAAPRSSPREWPGEGAEVAEWHIAGDTGTVGTAAEAVAGAVGAAAGAAVGAAGAAARPATAESLGEDSEEEGEEEAGESRRMCMGRRGRTREGLQGVGRGEGARDRGGVDHGRMRRRGRMVEMENEHATATDADTASDGDIPAASAGIFATANVHGAHVVSADNTEEHSLNVAGMQGQVVADPPPHSLSASSGEGMRSRALWRWQQQQQRLRQQFSPLPSLLPSPSRATRTTRATHPRQQQPEQQELSPEQQHLVPGQLVLTQQQSASSQCRLGRRRVSVHGLVGRQSRQRGSGGERRVSGDRGLEAEGEATVGVGLTAVDGEAEEMVREGGGDSAVDSVVETPAVPGEDSEAEREEAGAGEAEREGAGEEVEAERSGPGVALSRVVMGHEGGTEGAASPGVVTHNAPDRSGPRGVALSGVVMGHEGGTEGAASRGAVTHALDSCAPSREGKRELHRAGGSPSCVVDFSGNATCAAGTAAATEASTAAVVTEASIAAATDARLPALESAQGTPVVAVATDASSLTHPAASTSAAAAASTEGARGRGGGGETSMELCISGGEERSSVEGGDLADGESALAVRDRQIETRGENVVGLVAGMQERIDGVSEVPPATAGATVAFGSTGANTSERAANLLIANLVASTDVVAESLAAAGAAAAAAAAASHSLPASAAAFAADMPDSTPGPAPGTASNTPEPAPDATELDAASDEILDMVHDISPDVIPDTASDQAPEPAAIAEAFPHAISPASGPLPSQQPLSVRPVAAAAATATSVGATAPATAATAPAASRQSVSTPFPAAGPADAPYTAVSTTQPAATVSLPLPLDNVVPSSLVSHASASDSQTLPILPASSPVPETSMLDDSPVAPTLAMHIPSAIGEAAAATYALPAPSMATSLTMPSPSAIGEAAAAGTCHSFIYADTDMPQPSYTANIQPLPYESQGAEQHCTQYNPFDSYDTVASHVPSNPFGFGAPAAPEPAAGAASNETDRGTAAVPLPGAGTSSAVESCPMEGWVLFSPARGEGVGLDAGPAPSVAVAPAVAVAATATAAVADAAAPATAVARGLTTAAAAAAAAAAAGESEAVREPAEVTVSGRGGEQGSVGAEQGRAQRESPVRFRRVASSGAVQMSTVSAGMPLPTAVRMGSPLRVRGRDSLTGSGVLHSSSSFSNSFGGGSAAGGSGVGVGGAGSGVIGGSSGSASGGVSVQGGVGSSSNRGDVVLRMHEQRQQQRQRLLLLRLQRMLLTRNESPSNEDGEAGEGEENQQQQHLSQQQHQLYEQLQSRGGGRDEQALIDAAIENALFGSSASSSSTTLLTSSAASAAAGAAAASGASGNDSITVPRPPVPVRFPASARVVAALATSGTGTGAGGSTVAGTVTGAGVPLVAVLGGPPIQVSSRRTQSPALTHTQPWGGGVASSRRHMGGERQRGGAEEEEEEGRRDRTGGGVGGRRGGTRVGGGEAGVGEEGRGGEEVEPLEALCCVCMERYRKAAFVPCGHMLCRTCAQEVRDRRGKCPLCNRKIKDVLKLY